MPPKQAKIIEYPLEKQSFKKTVGGFFQGSFFEHLGFGRFPSLLAAELKEAPDSEDNADEPSLSSNPPLLRTCHSSFDHINQTACRRFIYVNAPEVRDTEDIIHVAKMKRIGERRKVKPKKSIEIQQKVAMPRNKAVMSPIPVRRATRTFMQSASNRETRAVMRGNRNIDVVFEKRGGGRGGRSRGRGRPPSLNSTTPGKSVDSPPQDFKRKEHSVFVKLDAHPKEVDDSGEISKREKPYLFPLSPPLSPIRPEEDNSDSVKKCVSVIAQFPTLNETNDDDLVKIEEESFADENEESEQPVEEIHTLSEDDKKDEESRLEMTQENSQSQAYQVQTDLEDHVHEEKEFEEEKDVEEEKEVEKDKEVDEEEKDNEEDDEMPVEVDIEETPAIEEGAPFEDNNSDLSEPNDNEHNQEPSDSGGESKQVDLKRERYETIRKKKAATKEALRERARKAAEGRRRSLKNRRERASQQDAVSEEESGDEARPRRSQRLQMEKEKELQKTKETKTRKKPADRKNQSSNKKAKMGVSLSEERNAAEELALAVVLCLWKLCHTGPEPVGEDRFNSFVHTTSITHSLPEMADLLAAHIFVLPDCEDKSSVITCLPTSVRNALHRKDAILAHIPYLPENIAESSVDPEDFLLEDLLPLPKSGIQIVKKLADLWLPTVTSFNLKTAGDFLAECKSRLDQEIAEGFEESIVSYKKGEITLVDLKKTAGEVFLTHTDLLGRFNSFIEGLDEPDIGPSIRSSARRALKASSHFAELHAAQSEKIEDNIRTSNFDSQSLNNPLLKNKRKLGPEGSLLPALTLGDLTVISVGTPVAEPAFHNRSHIYPPGFRSRRIFNSFIRPGAETAYVMTIESRAKRPTFKLFAEDCPHMVLESYSSTLAVRDLFKLLANVSIYPPGASSHGPYFFGFGNPIVLTLIRSHPNALECSHRHFFPSPSAGLIRMMSTAHYQGTDVANAPGAIAGPTKGPWAACIMAASALSEIDDRSFWRPPSEPTSLSTPAQFLQARVAQLERHIAQLSNTALPAILHLRDSLYNASESIQTLSDEVLLLRRKRKMKEIQH